MSKVGRGRKTPQVALFGYGAWGRNLARNFDELGALQAIVESDEARAALAQKERPGVPIVGSMAELSASAVPPEAVVIATPAETHARLCRQALELGFDAFVEKPLALDPKEGQALVDLAREKGRVLAVGHLLLYHPAARALVHLVRSGELGRIRYVYSNRLNWGKVRREENILWSFAPHDIALLLELLGESPDEVTAHGSAYLHPHIADVTVSHLHFPSGVSAHIHVSWLNPFKEQRLVVVGDERMAVFEDTAADHKLVVYDHEIDWVDRLPVARKAHGRPIPFAADEPLRVECQSFLESIRTRKAPLADGDNGVAVLEILSACQRSLELGGDRVALGARPPKKAFVHETAVVDPGAQLAAGAKVWHFAHVMPGARIGAGASLGQNVFVGPGVPVGAGARVQNNVSLYAGVEVGEEAFIGPSAVFTNVRHPRSHESRKDAFETTKVGRRATVGANATIRCGVTLGDYSFVGAGAVVTRDVPASAIVVGNPARLAGWACACGEKLAWPTEPEDGAQHVCSRCGTTSLWRSGRVEYTELPFASIPVDTAEPTVAIR